MTSARSTHDIKIKLLMIGDSGVGKSCLVLRFSNNELPPLHVCMYIYIHHLHLHLHTNNNLFTE